MNKRKHKKQYKKAKRAIQMFMSGVIQYEGRLLNKNNTIPVRAKNIIKEDLW